MKRLSCLGAMVAFTLIALPSLALSAAPPHANDQNVSRPLADVLEEITPAVVNIAVKSGSPRGTNPLYNDPFFRRYFDLPEAQERLSAGSGVIVDAGKGYILTNHHVIANAGEISVTLKDRRRFVATLVGSDKATDIALIRIDAPQLRALPLGNSDQLRVGDTVVAIGNPFGLGQTVTSGIVSALGRSGINIEGYEDFIQTDASINPGNSGGAPVTADGKLVGINAAIIAPAGGNVGIGFAVPVAMASTVMQQLIEYGEVRRGRIGIVIQDVTPDLAQALGLADSAGVVVSSVEEGSAAANAGLQAGDVITSVNKHPVSSSADLRNRVGLSPVGSQIEVEYTRNGSQKAATMRIEAGGSAEAAGAVPSRLEGADFQDAGGAIVVRDIEEGSPAAQTGLRIGDVVVAVNRKPVSSLSELNEALSDARGTIALDLIRGREKLFLVIR
jgi:Do/DeqQ family serine protease